MLVHPAVPDPVEGVVGVRETREELLFGPVGSLLVSRHLISLVHRLVPLLVAGFSQRAKALQVSSDLLAKDGMLRLRTKPELVGPEGAPVRNRLGVGARLESLSQAGEGFALETVIFGPWDVPINLQGVGANLPEASHLPPHADRILPRLAGIRRGEPQVGPREAWIPLRGLAKLRNGFLLSFRPEQGAPI
jgi:hypothetical protein